MTPIDPAKLNTTRLQAASVTPIQRTAPARPVTGAATEASARPSAAALSGPTAGTNSPVDVDRVAQIRKAVEEGTYPLIPTRIADAMIAAGYLLRAPR